MRSTASPEPGDDLEAPLAPRVLVFVGPSGSGKSSVVRELHRRGVVAVTPSWTTRPRRPDEVGGSLEHRFVTEEEFAALEAAGFFLGTAALFGLPHRYGLPPVAAADGAAVPAILVRAPLLPLVGRHFPDRVVYQVEDSAARVRERLAARGVSGPALGTRLTGYEQERDEGRRRADRVFVNAGTLADLVDEVAAAVAADFSLQEVRS